MNGFDIIECDILNGESNDEIYFNHITVNCFNDLFRW